MKGAAGVWVGVDAGVDFAFFFFCGLNEKIVFILFYFVLVFVPDQLQLNFVGAMRLAEEF